MTKKWAAAAVVTLLIALPIGFHVVRGKEVKEVETTKADLRAITPSILASGTLAYESQVTLVSEVLGRVDQVLVKVGDRVAKGQLLLRLDPASSRAELAQMRAGRDQSELNVERQRVSLEAMSVKIKRFEDLNRQGFVETTKFEDLSAQRAVAEVELRTSHEAVKQANAQLAQSQQRMSKNEIRAPIDGRVTQVSVRAGETVIPSAMSIAGGSLVVIADTSNIFAEINVDETDIARVAIGQQADVVPAAFPDKSLKGTVEQIAIAPRQNGNQARSYPVRVRLQPSADVVFHPGMSARAEIAISKGNARRVGVPVQAIQYAEPERKSEKVRASIFVIRDGNALKRDVETGLADDSHIEILKGLNAGDAIVIGPPKTLRFLRDGDAVRTKATAEQSAWSSTRGLSTRLGSADPHS